MDQHKRLFSLLQHCDSPTIIGIGIRTYLNNNEDLYPMCLQLQDLAKENPDVMIGILGDEAMKLLLCENFDFSVR